jgi:fructosamine-3-kinase
MWQGIVQQLSTVLGREFQLHNKQKVTGGDISFSYVISDLETHFFVKVNEKDFLPQFIGESDNLKALIKSLSINVPQPILVGTTKGYAFLVLEYLQLTDIENDACSYQLGEQLAYLHRWGEQKEYGFDQDNYIGKLIQPNAWDKKWDRFFAEQRIGWQLQLLYEKGIVLADIDQFVDLIKQMLSHHQPKPALLHGDLWHGNVARTGLTPVCFDPACYWGDRECDIAMTELFGRFPAEFYRGYESILPLMESYQQRKTIYNLYHVLNHCNHFGGHYLNEAQQMVRTILSAL